MKTPLQTFFYLLTLAVFFSCGGNRNATQLKSEIKLLDLAQGEIALCGSGAGQFGKVLFGQACSEKVQDDFNLATALLHSFEYVEAEKVFAKVIDADPECAMGYWGAAMCNFHPLWEKPGEADLKKGSKIVALGRSVIKDKSSRESDYLEAIATIYDHWDSLDHQTRVLKFEDASLALYKKYPNETESAVFYALALRVAADPKDKTFVKQKKAGEMLEAIFVNQPDHPGIAHYIIHTYDYPELAELALPAARKYASIAAASAHAQHMPSHIFTRLGLWDESVASNVNSVAAAQCYGEKMNMHGHWDEELHGLDYLVYAYLQQGNDTKANEQFDYYKSVKAIAPDAGKGAFSLASIPARCAVERRDWKAAAALEWSPAISSWDRYPWERSNVTFAKVLGAVHTKNIAAAKDGLKALQDSHDALVKAKENYKANFLAIQIKASEAWIKFAEGNATAAVPLMTEAADLEDQTEKHPVSPGEIVPARELLGDLFMAMNEPAKALEAYEADLVRHPRRFNGLYGAAQAAEKLKDRKKATEYYLQLKDLTNDSNCSRPEILAMNTFLKGNNL
jgi:tetratricopeptide (TPR) repeat protein